MTEIELPHEETKKVYCPNLCPFAGSYFDTPCILKKELTEPKIIEGRNFNSEKEITMSTNDIQEYIGSRLNPLQKIEGVVKQPNFVQVFFSHNCCPLWAMREVYGPDWQNWFSPEVRVENGQAIYPLIDHLGNVQNNFQYKLKEKVINGSIS